MSLVLDTSNSASAPMRTNKKSGRNRRYACPHCPYSNKNLKKVDTHVLSFHTTAKSFKCSNCTYSAHFEYLLTAHLKLHDNTDQQPQRQDGAVRKEEMERKSAVSLDNDVNEEEGNDGEVKEKEDEIPMEKVPSTPLMLDTSSWASMPITSRKIDGRRRYQCPHCPYIAITMRYVDTHVLAFHTTAKALKCSNCSYSADYEYRLTAHLKMHDNIDKQPQDEAGTVKEGEVEEKMDEKAIKKVPSTPLMLDTSSSASMSISSQKSDSKRRWYVCPHCPYANVNLRIVEEHVNAGHKKTKAFKCSNCTYSAQHEHLLLTHNKLHANNDNQPQKKEKQVDRKRKEPLDAQSAVSAVKRRRSTKREIEREGEDEAMEERARLDDEILAMGVAKEIEVPYSDTPFESPKAAADEACNRDLTRAARLCRQKHELLHRLEQSDTGLDAATRAYVEEEYRYLMAGEEMEPLVRADETGERRLLNWQEIDDARNDMGLELEPGRGEGAESIDPYSGSTSAYFARTVELTKPFEVDGSLQVVKSFHRARSPPLDWSHEKEEMKEDGDPTVPDGYETA